MNDAILLLDPLDNVGVAVENLAPRQQCSIIDNPQITLSVLEEIPFCHKVAIRDIPQGEPIVKYGEALGVAKTPIAKGSWVHLHNLHELQLAQQK